MRRSQDYLQRFLLATGIALLLLPLIFASWCCFVRPPRTNIEQTLFQGIVYKRQALSIPRPMMLHIVTVDLEAPGLKVLVTPSEGTSDRRINKAQTTSQFLTEFKLQLAINANYFHPFHENTPWDYYPHNQDVTYVIGQAISNGQRYSQSDPHWKVLCISAKNRAQILDSGQCPEDTMQGVAGDRLLVTQGQPVVDESPSNKPYPRVAVATNQLGNKLWLIAVDGKQPFYSEGITIAELTKIVTGLGAYTALNLDGGGSTTLVTAVDDQLQLLNAPIHTKIPMRQRPVANHLGFYALP